MTFTAENLCGIGRDACHQHINQDFTGPDLPVLHIVDDEGIAERLLRSYFHLFLLSSSPLNTQRTNVNAMRRTKLVHTWYDVFSWSRH
jgi:hypothetical protein